MALPGAAGGRGRELAIRVVVGAGLAGVALSVTYWGGWWFNGFVFAVAVVGLGEWLVLRRATGGSLPMSLASGAVALACLPFVTGTLLFPALSYYVLFGALFAFAVIRFGRGRLTPDGEMQPVSVVETEIARGGLYVGAAMCAMIYLRQQGFGLEYVAFTFAIVWSADVAAFSVGRLVGGPKLWPSISPSKTWAGFAGACVAATGASVAVVPYVHVAPGRAAVAGLLLGALAQGGDLFESWLKRRAGVKDSGTLLPGHGGVLDRLDSLIPVAPTVAGAVWLGWL